MRDFEYSVKEKLTCTYLLKNNKKIIIWIRGRNTHMPKPNLISSP